MGKVHLGIPVSLRGSKSLSKALAQELLKKRQGLRIALGLPPTATSAPGTIVTLKELLTVADTEEAKTLLAQLPEYKPADFGTVATTVFRGTTYEVILGLNTECADFKSLLSDLAEKNAISFPGWRRRIIDINPPGGQHQRQAEQVVSTVNQLTGFSYSLPNIDLAKHIVGELKDTLKRPFGRFVLHSNAPEPFYYLLSPHHRRGYISTGIIVVRAVV